MTSSTNGSIPTDGITGDPARVATARPGTQALSLLSVPLNNRVLQVLTEGPCPLIDLRRTAGAPPQTTLRLYMKTLIEMGVIEQRRQNGFPGAVECEITRSGEELLRVADVLERWLRQGGEDPVSLGSQAGRKAVKALIGGWSSNLVRALAARPLALTQLNCVIPGISYPTLERRLRTMRDVGLIELQQTSKGRGTPYKVTDWLRTSIIPLAAAVAWEGRSIPKIAGLIGRMDVEATLLLAAPILELPPGVSGRGRFSVELRGETESTYAGISVQVQDGRVTSCVSRLEGEADAWVVGTPIGWFRWIKRGEADSVEIGGNSGLADGLANGLRSTFLEASPISLHGSA
jgi:DNA-binding HxlR family transcriptional regulator